MKEHMMGKSRIGRIAIAVVALYFVAASVDAAAQFQPPGSLGALAPANIAKPRPKPPFDLTGTWLHGGGPDNNFRFAPPPGFKLKPEAQVHYDAAQAAAKEGKVYRNDIGICWPAGLPQIMTRVWPIAMIQLPTAIYMVSEFMNSMRVIYLDGRTHTDPDIVVRSFNGESIGRWEGDTLVVDTRHFVGHHHWVDNGIPASEDFRVIERMRLIDKGMNLEIQYTLIDPKGWEGEWKMTKRWRRVDERDIAEVSCLPDLNENMPSVQSKDNVR
jgi:hypothetical protein